MLFRVLLLCSLTVVSSATCLAQTPEAKQPTSYYLIGNSLTWDTIPSWLDGDVQWHVDCGVSLPHIFDNPSKPCVKTSTLWPKALSGKQYDYISMQPHYGSNLQQDVDVISKWVKMQRKAIFIIHAGWARHATFADEYASEDVSGQLAHSPAYMAELLKQLRARHPDRAFRQTYSTELLHKIAHDIEAGTAPFDSITELYRDKIHMKLESGRYLMHNAMRLALDQPRSKRKANNAAPKIIAYLDSVLDTLKK